MTNKDLQKVLSSINNKRGTINNGYRSSMYVLSEVEEVKGSGLYLVTSFSNEDYFVLKDGDTFVAILYLGHFHYFVPKKYRGRGYAKKIAILVFEYVHNNLGQSLRTEIHGEDQSQHDASEHIIRDLIGMTIDQSDGRYHTPERSDAVKYGHIMFDVVNDGFGIMGFQPKTPFTCGIVDNFAAAPGLKVAVKVLSNDVLLFKPLLTGAYCIAILGARTHRILSVMQLCGGGNIYYQSRSPYLNVKRESKIMKEKIIPYLKRIYGDTYDEMLLVFERRTINDLVLTGDFQVNRYGEIEIKLK